MRGKHNAEVVRKPHSQWHVHSHDSEWRRRVELAIDLVDAVPTVHGPDLTTPITLLRETLDLQANLASLEYRRAMTREKG